jgi:hypothetical protein
VALVSLPYALGGFGLSTMIFDRYLPDFMTMNWKSRAKKIGQLMRKAYGGKDLAVSSAMTNDNTTELAEIGWERGINGLNTNTLAYKLRMSENSNGLTRQQQAYTCGVVFEGGSDIVSRLMALSRYSSN